MGHEQASWCQLHWRRPAWWRICTALCFVQLLRFRHLLKPSAASQNVRPVVKRPPNRSSVWWQVHKVHEEEWSYIPVGGPLPRRDQAITAFGAAANLVHPATGCV